MNRILIVGSVAGFALLACDRPADRAELAGTVYAVVPHGTPIEEATRRMTAAGFDCDSVRMFAPMPFDSDSIRAVPCLNNVLRGAKGSTFLLVVQQDRVSDVLIQRRE